ncbi:hypothetical protein [Cryptosporangium minutisporangium]|uniref:PhoD-like phosphatase metallophosphatase domain-containing protein n=1 Tax=Cryptosporangium minutisporangium TaxID=113569 RepID=A0ABP6SZD9_9ACTN
MAFTSLQSRLGQLPLVLAGPILRRTDARTVTVWVALREARSVAVEVFADGAGAVPLLRGERATVRLGERLHVVAVTARSSQAVLEPGKIYLYDLDFGNNQRLASPNVLSSTGGVTAMAAVAYAGFSKTLPSFALPPSSLGQLRIVHGSCRKSHGGGADALTALHTMLLDSVTDPFARPHHLLLTGDQIYADDVPDVLLHLIRDARTALGLPGEALPDIAPDSPELEPGHRGLYATDQAGMTAVVGIGSSSDFKVAKSHLLTFAEYALMYLFAWSPVLWPAAGDLPAVDRVHPPGTTVDGKDPRKYYAEELAAVTRFRAALADVRHGLANVPTYMIFDDHDVSDDWFLNQAWSRRVLTKPAGRQVVQNGLLAFALFQAWGNTPEAFESGWGAGLLAVAPNWAGSTPILESTLENNRLRHPSDWPTWNFRVTGPDVEAGGVTGPRYELIVLDARTWRSFPGGMSDPPALIEDGRMALQFPPREQTVEVSFVVAPAPVVGNPLPELIQEKVGTGPYGAFIGDRETWELHRGTFEALITRLAARGRPGADGRRKARVVLLSGDVHYGFTTRLQYWGDRPFRELAPAGSDLVAAQLTASACKNQEIKTYVVHAAGYGGLPESGSKRTLGWRARPQVRTGLPSVLPAAWVKTRWQPWLLAGEPPVLELETTPPLIDVTPPPDWAHRRDYLVAAGDLPTALDWAAILPVGVPGNPDPEQFRRAIGKFLGRRAVGVNNFGEVRLTWGSGEDKAVVHTLWWRRKGESTVPIEPLRVFTVSLSFSDANYPRPTAAGAP